MLSALAPRRGGFLYIAHMDTGILTLAAGHPQYGKYAAALAVTLRAKGYTGPLSVLYTVSDVGGKKDVHSLSDIQPDHRDLFDAEILVPNELCFYERPHGNIIKRTKAYHLPKLSLDLLTPYTNATLFLDADTAALTDLTPHIEGLLDSGQTFLPQCNNIAKRSADGKDTLYPATPYYTYWTHGLENAVPTKIFDDLRACALGHMMQGERWLPQTQTTYMWLTKDGFDVMRTARELLLSNSLAVGGWAGSVPDEAYINAAWCLTGRGQLPPYRPVLCPVVGKASDYVPLAKGWTSANIAAAANLGGCVAYTPAFEGSGNFAIGEFYNRIVSESAIALRVPAAGLHWVRKSTFNQQRVNG